MTAAREVHEQSRLQFWAAFLTGFVVVILAVILIGWAISTPMSDPRNEQDPRPAVTEYAQQPYSA